MRETNPGEIRYSDSNKKRAVIFAVCIAFAVLMCALYSALDLIPDKEIEAELVSAEVQPVEWMIPTVSVSLVFSDPEVSSGVVEVIGYRDDDPSFSFTYVVRFSGSEGICRAEIGNVYEDRFEVGRYSVSPVKAVPDGVDSLPMVGLLVAVCALLFVSFYRAATLNDGRHKVSASRWLWFTRLKADGKVVARSSERDAETLTANVDGIVYSANFARYSDPSICADGVCPRETESSDMADRYRRGFKKNIVILVILAIAAIVCVALPELLPRDSVVEAENFFVADAYGSYADIYFRPTGNGKVGSGTIYIEWTGSGDTDSYKFEIGDDGFAYVNAHSHWDDESASVHSYYPNVQKLDVRVPGSVITMFLVYGVVALAVKIVNPVAGWTVDGHRIIAYVENKRCNVTVDGVPQGFSVGDGYGPVGGTVGGRQFCVFFEKYKKPRLEIDGAPYEEENKK